MDVGRVLWPSELRDLLQSAPCGGTIPHAQLRAVQAGDHVVRLLGTLVRAGTIRYRSAPLTRSGAGRLLTGRMRCGCHSATPRRCHCRAYDPTITIAAHLSVMSTIHTLTAVGFKPTPLRTGALSQRLRPLGQTVLINSLLKQSLLHFQQNNDGVYCSLFSRKRIHE